jgi:hypothetical protein
VHSPFARPTSVHSNGDRHLIYDQYLGQVFNRLTRIEFTEADSEVVYSYAFKLFGQRNLIRGEFATAAAMAKSSVTIATQEKVQAALAESEDQFKLRTMVAAMQEYFALCHELVHVVIEDGDGGRLREAFEPVLDAHTSGITDAVDGLTSGELRQYLAASLAADGANLAERRGRGAIEQNAFQLSDEELDHDIRRFADQIEKVRRPDIVQEAMCDHFAAVLAAEFLGSTNEGRPLVYAASALGLLHLRLIQYLDGVADPAEVSQNDFDQAILRASILRTGLRLDLMARPGGEELAAEFHNLATVFNERHSKIVLDQVMTFDLARFASDRAAEAPTVPDDAEVRQRLGFGAMPRISQQQAKRLLVHRNEMSRATIDGIAESAD